MSPHRLSGTVATVAVQAFDMAAQVGVGVMVARGLGPEAMGDFTFAYAVVGALSIVLLFGTAEIAIPQYAAQDLEARLILGASLRRLARGARWCLGLGVLVVVVLRVPPMTAVAVALGTAALLANGLSATANAAILGLGLSTRDVPWVVGTRGVLLLTAGVGVRLGSLPVVLAGGVVAALGLAVARIAIVQSHGGLWRAGWRAARHDASAVEVLLRSRSAPVGLSGVFGMVSARSDMLLLQHLGDATTIGHYGAAYRVINGLVAGTNALVVALYPRLASPVPSVRRAALRAFVVLPAIICTGLFVASVFSTELLVVVYGPAFARAGSLFRVLLLASAVQVVLCFLSRQVVASGRERVMPWAQAAAAVVNVATNLALIPSMGGSGAAIATLCAEATALSAYLVQLKWGGRPPRHSPASVPA